MPWAFGAGARVKPAAHAGWLAAAAAAAAVATAVAAVDSGNQQYGQISLPIPFSVIVRFSLATPVLPQVNFPLFSFLVTVASPKE